jgi:hypothetical protein
LGSPRFCDITVWVRKLKSKGKKKKMFTLNKKKLFGHRKGKIPSRTKMWNKLEEIIRKDFNPIKFIQRKCCFLEF